MTPHSGDSAARSRVGARDLVTGTVVAGVIGSPIRHSRSPAIFNAAFAAAGLDWAYAAFDVPEGDAAGALAGMRALGLGGLSVTMPHKEAVAALVDELSDDAAALGAVNCVVPVDGGRRLRGESTDGGGFLDSLAAAGVAVAGARCVVLGAGGAARAVILALARAGASDVAVVNRTPERAERAAALAGDRGRVAGVGAVGAAALVVNATSVGMGGSGELPLDPALLGHEHVVVDLVYAPLDTPLLVAARSAGATTVDGLGMLVHQAARAFTHWTGETAAPIEAMTSAARSTGG